MKKNRNLYLLVLLITAMLTTNLVYTFADELLVVDALSDEEVELASISDNSVEDTDEETATGEQTTTTSETAFSDEQTLDNTDIVDAEIPMSDDVSSLGYDETDISRWNKNHESDCITYTTIDSGTWGFNQTMARGELFNEFNKARSNPANWWYCTNGSNEPITTTSITLTNTNFVYDYELEKLAMQRCVELPFAYGHMRPCGCVYQSVAGSVDNNIFGNLKDLAEMNGMYGDTAENIVKLYMEGYDCADTYNQLYGYPYTDDQFLTSGGQGHRKIILDNKKYKIGIAVIETIDGWVYTEILTSSVNNPNNTPTPCIDGYKEITVELGGSTKGLANVTLNAQKIHMDVGETISYDELYMGRYGVVLTKANDTTLTGGGWKPTSPLAQNKISVDNTRHTFTALAPGEETLEGLNGRCSIGIIINEPPTPDPEPPTPTPVNPPIETPTYPSYPVTPQLQSQTITLRSGRTSYACKAKTLKKKKKTYNVYATAPSGKVTYKVTSYPKGGKKYIKVNSEGKVTIKKGAKKGTYKVTLSAPGTAYYLPATTTVTFKVKG